MDSIQQRQHWARKCYDFLQGTAGLPVREGTPGASSFMPYVAVERGALVVDLEHAFAGDLLHEAGHLAVIPGRFRPLASGNLRDVLQATLAHVRENPEGLMQWPEDPTVRQCMQSQEAEAVAWSFASAHHIGLPREMVYAESSPWGDKANRLEADAEETLCRLGAAGLASAGWTSTAPMGPNWPTPQFPKLAFWLAAH